MKKEAINTFGEGMIMDLHPLTTPNNVLTNCLNGTLITYNGNEFILQNDMGNGEVHTAYLDKGYVPVGMKEHGGIIYVAAHNPITKKSQIGSFPSPQQLYEGDDLNVNPININFNNFIYEDANGIPHIKSEYYKQKLFQITNSDNLKIFHPGDKFIIVTNSLDAQLKEAINKGIVKLKLGVINKSNNIDYIDDSKLRLYSNGLWIYESTSSVFDILRNKNLVQIFSAKSSGALILTIQINTFETFNLIKKYSQTLNTINVKLIGETTGKYKGNSIDNPNINIMENNSLPNTSITISGSSPSVISKTIYPVCPYGALDRMAKNLVIDFEAIRSNLENINEWRFFVTDTYIKIGWGYDYYNLNQDSDIEKIEFTFINIEDSTKLNSKNDINSSKGDYIYTISKEYYSGSFEEIIPFEDNTIKKNWIYLVRIDRYCNNKSEIIGYKLIYTSPYFNQFYEEVLDFTKGTDINNQTVIPNKNRTPIAINIKSQLTKNIINISPQSLAIKVGKATEYKDVTSINVSLFISDVTDLLDNFSDYKYETRKTGHYKVEITPSVKYDYPINLYAGTPNGAILDNYFGTNPTINNIEFDHTNIQNNNDSTLSASITLPNSKNSEFKWELNQFVGTLETSRYIYANAGNIATKHMNSEHLEQVYSINMPSSEKRKLFSFSDSGGILRCTLGDEDSITYNGIIQSSGNIQTKGESTGSHFDDNLQTALINMGNGTVGIMGGKQGDKASLRYEAYKRRTIDGWYCSKNEVDDEDNFLIATWKDTNGVHHLTNLISKKQNSGNLLNDSHELIRVDKMLKCILSLMLVAKKYNKEITFIGPNSNDFIYQKAGNTICKLLFSIPLGNVDINVDFSLSNGSIESHIKKIQTYIPELVNYMPIFKIHKSSEMTVNIEFGSDIDFSKDATILNCYTNAYSSLSASSSDLTDTERGALYLADTSLGYTINADGSFNLNVIKPGTSKTTIKDWFGRNWKFNSNIDSMFTTSYKFENRSGNIPDDYYNEVLIKDYTDTRGRWVKKGDGDAPRLAGNILYSNKSIYTI